ncbi:MAG: ornithine--acyl-ACP N-acyltransferase OlsB [Rhizobiales bacterium PAR1]|nr:MAG: ornithine--acyl-ACP N-acyltransferase OlsB [Rhizobiales bacterium PAR1]
MIYLAPHRGFVMETAPMLRSRLPGSAGSKRLPLLAQPFSPARFVQNLNPTSRIVRSGEGLPDTLGQLGTLEVRLARTTKDIRRAQRLRFKVFFNEMSATPNARAFVSRRDIDPFDRICDHILVIDHAAKISRFGKPKPKVIGTYRLLRSDVAAAVGTDFYTAGEYDLKPLLAANPGLKMLELGRSCVLKPYRNKRTVELLWHGVWRYILHHKIDLMFGCASFEGTDPSEHALALSFLHHHASAPEGLAARAVPWLYTPMNRMAPTAIDLKSAMKALPPLIKGYLRLGATFGDGAVIDRQFGTVDVFVALKVKDIDPRYVAYYGADAGRHS